MMGISSACPTCGTVAKSGKKSCCGPGGSWFRRCGNAGNAQLRHTWHEGILVCKTRAQSKTAMELQVKAAQQGGSVSFNDVDKVSFEAVIATEITFSSPMPTNTTILQVGTTPTGGPTTTPANGSIDALSRTPDHSILATAVVQPSTTSDDAGRVSSKSIPTASNTIAFIFINMWLSVLVVVF